MTNESKNKKTKFCWILTPMVWVLSNGIEDTPLQQFLFSSLHSFDSIFWGIRVWTDKPHNGVKGICFKV